MRLAIVSGICVERDAISAAVAAQASTASTVEGVTAVDVFVEHLDRDVDADVHIVRDPWALLTHDVFQRADVAIFHFGIRYTIFDTIVGIDAVRTRPVVHFHNITPIDLVPDVERQAIEESHRQLHAAIGVDSHFWVFSEFSRRTLIAWGVDQNRLRFVPFPIEPSRPVRPQPDAGEFSLLAIGRLVPSKGIHVILEALARARPSIRRPVQLTLVGNRAFSQPDYIDELERFLVVEDLRDAVSIIADADDETLWQCYERADVVVSASLHEGLCVPVIEGYIAGCRAIGTTAGNLPFVVQPPDVVVEPEDPAALAEALVRLDAELVSGHSSRRDAARQLCLRYSRDATRQAMGSALQNRLAVGADHV